jgi:hypothetical protein
MPAEDDRLSASELRKRYDISKQRAWQLMRQWSASPDGPSPRRFTGRWYVATADLERWEAAQRAAGLPLPGERRRGPHPERA